MAGLGGKNWTFEEEVTSSDVNGYLADQVVMRFADSATRTAGFGGAGEPTLAEGMVSYLDDTNRLAYYNGSSWVDVPVVGDFGLQLIKAQTIGTSVSSVAVTDVFSSTYDNYRIIVSGGSGNAAGDVRLQFGSTTTGYYAGYSRVNYSGGTAATASDNNAANFSGAGVMNTNGLFMNVEVGSPNLAANTFVFGGLGANITTDRGIVFGGFINATTQFTGFTILTATGQMTGGTIRVYGYRNS